jgi:hypothetical protein
VRIELSNGDISEVNIDEVEFESDLMQISGSDCQSLPDLESDV